MSLWVWRARGRPLPPVPPVDLRDGIGRHPILVALGVVVGGALVYQLFIVLATPPNNWDSMSYHLPRAAEWLQRARVEYVPDPPTERINALQPGSELEILWTFAFLGRDTAAALPQLLAEVASLVGVYAIARRIGFGRPDSVFASLLAGTLTQVALQSVTTQNDLLAASFVVAAAALVLGRSRAEVVLAGGRARTRARNQADSGLCDPGPARARDHGPPAATTRRVRRRGRRRVRPGRSLRLRPQRRRDGKTPRRPVRNRAVPTGGDHVGRNRIDGRAHRLPLLRPLRPPPEGGRPRLDRECRPLGLRRPRDHAEPAGDECRAAVRLRRRPGVQRGHLLLRPARCAARPPALTRFRGRDDRAPGAVGTARARRRSAVDRARDRAHLPLQHLARPFPDHPGPADDAARRRALPPASAGCRGRPRGRGDARRGTCVQHREADRPRRDGARLVADARRGTGADTPGCEGRHRCDRRSGAGGRARGRHGSGRVGLPALRPRARAARDSAAGLRAAGRRRAARPRLGRRRHACARSVDPLRAGGGCASPDSGWTLFPASRAARAATRSP